MGEGQIRAPRHGEIILIPAAPDDRGRPHEFHAAAPFRGTVERVPVGPQPGYFF